MWVSILLITKPYLISSESPGYQVYNLMNFHNSTIFYHFSLNFWQEERYVAKNRWHKIKAVLFDFRDFMEIKNDNSKSCYGLPKGLCLPLPNQLSRPCYFLASDNQRIRDKTPTMGFSTLGVDSTMHHFSFIQFTC